MIYERLFAFVNVFQIRKKALKRDILVGMSNEIVVLLVTRCFPCSGEFYATVEGSASYAVSYS